MNPSSTPDDQRGSYVEPLYRQDADPWRVRQRWYEERKRALLLASLPQRRYRHAYEPGCGNGELTAELARRCERAPPYQGTGRLWRYLAAGGGGAGSVTPPDADLEPPL